MTTQEVPAMDDETTTSLHLVPETGIEEASEEDWIEEIDESDLPPNAWQQELGSLIRLENEVWTERQQLLEEPEN